MTSWDPNTWVVGLDLSLTNPAGCIVPMQPDWLRWVSTWRPKIPDGHEHRIDRVIAIRDMMQCWCRPARGNIYHVFIEGYSFASQGNALTKLAELGGAVRAALRQMPGVVLHADVPPSSWRKFLLGKVPRAGSKEAAHVVLQKILKERIEPCVPSPVKWSGDELDALGVANWGIADLGGVGVSVAS